MFIVVAEAVVVAVKYKKVNNSNYYNSSSRSKNNTVNIYNSSKFGSVCVDFAKMVNSLCL